MENKVIHLSEKEILRQGQLMEIFEQHYNAMTKLFKFHPDLRAIERYLGVVAAIGKNQWLQDEKEEPLELVIAQVVDSFSEIRGVCIEYMMLEINRELKNNNKGEKENDV